MLRAVPPILQNTLFHSSSLAELRTKDSSKLFFLADDVKAKGNRLYKKGNYYGALAHYEKALSMFKWIEFSDPARQTAVLEGRSLFTEERGT